MVHLLFPSSSKGFGLALHYAEQFPRGVSCHMRVRFNAVVAKQDLFLIPFSLLWGGFAIFWEGSVAGFWNHSTMVHAYVE